MFKEEDYIKLYEELSQHKVLLDGDPVKIGLNSLLVKLAEVQEGKNRISQMFLDSIKNLDECEKSYDIANFVYERELEEILRSRRDIMELKSEKLRTSAANAELTTQLNNLLTAEQHLNRAKNYHKSVKIVHDNLESTNANISRQLTVIEDMMEIGEIAIVHNVGEEGKQIKLK